jgi:hypothetical protein
MESVEELRKRWRRIFQTLSAGTRRQIIGSLLEVPSDRKLSLPEAPNMPDYRLDPEKLQFNLVHNHLPMMANAGFVEWEQDPFWVKRGPQFEEVAAVIKAIDTYDDFPQQLIEGCHFHEQNRVNS